MYSMTNITCVSVGFKSSDLLIQGIKAINEKLKLLRSRWLDRKRNLGEWDLWDLIKQKQKNVHLNKCYTNKRNNIKAP